MSTTAISDPRNDGAARGLQGPSLIREDDVFFPRLIGILAAALTTFGAIALIMRYLGRNTAITPAWSTVALSFGMIGLLFHAAFDRDIQFRRVYMVFGYLSVAVGAFLMVIPSPKYFQQFGPGFILVSLGLLFLLCFLRHESDDKFRQVALYILSGAGAVMALTGLVGGIFKPVFLTGGLNQYVAGPVGLLLALLGLVYLISSVGVRGTSDELSYRIGLAIGIVGGVVLLMGLIGSFWPEKLFFTRQRGGSTSYFMPYGIILQLVGIGYILSSFAICSDAKIVVLTRREMGAYFFSPIAYLVLFSFVCAHWFGYSMFLWGLVTEGGMPEPVVGGMILQWPSIIWNLFGVPALTMRLLSEEKRANTLELTLTAPVDEGAIVTSKFLAAFVMYMLIWLPFALFLVALRIDSGKEFDIRPIFSFGIGLGLTGAAFVSMGLFFSSLTENQIVSGVLTFGAMLFLTLIFLAKRILSSPSLLGEDSAWISLMNHVSYIDIWIDTLRGKLVPKVLLFPTTMTVFFLFLTSKVLEMRKWK
jgi:ABC-2 type transport system permease protein